MFAFSPSWNWVANSFSRRSLAMPPVAAMLPAVSDASDVVSMLSTSPLAAMSCPFLSTMKTTLAFASRTRRSTTVWIRLNSSSYITIWGLTITPPAARQTLPALAFVIVSLGIGLGRPRRNQNPSPLSAERLYLQRFLLSSEQHFYLTPLERTR